MGDELESPNAFDEIHATDVINPIQPLPTTIKPSKLELKPLPDRLKYAYLGDDE